MFLLRKPFGILVFLISTSSLLSQSYQAELRGLVTDPSHAIVSGAKVTLIDEARHVSRFAESDAAGQYIFNQVDPASYRVEVEDAGFKRFARGSIVIGTQQCASTNTCITGKPTFRMSFA